MSTWKWRRYAAYDDDVLSDISHAHHCLKHGKAGTEEHIRLINEEAHQLSLEERLLIFFFGRLGRVRDSIANDYQEVQFVWRPDFVYPFSLMHYRYGPKSTDVSVVIPWKVEYFDRLIEERAKQGLIK